MANRQLDFSPRARIDLLRIAAYIASEASPEVAARFISNLEEYCRRIVLAPGMGTPYPGRLGVRKVAVENYKIIYRVLETHILILRVWDARRGREASF
jgi:plasmid stabilization system protein ParE